MTSYVFFPYDFKPYDFGSTLALYQNDSGPKIRPQCDGEETEQNHFQASPSSHFLLECILILWPFFSQVSIKVPTQETSTF